VNYLRLRVQGADVSQWGAQAPVVAELIVVPLFRRLAWFGCAIELKDIRDTGIRPFGGQRYW
jgi:hypothetical protein